MTFAYQKSEITYDICLSKEGNKKKLLMKFVYQKSETRRHCLLNLLIKRAKEEGIVYEICLSKDRNK